MILILTGEVRSGKTTFLKNLFFGAGKTLVETDGYLSEAVERNGEVAGYDLVPLGGRDPLPFLRLEGKDSWERIGPFFFRPRTLSLAKEIISNAPARKSRLLVVDEVGPLELEGRGIWPALESVLRTRNIPFLLVVRKNILDDFLPKLGGRKARVFHLSLAEEKKRLRSEIRRLLEKRKKEGA